MNKIFKSLFNWANCLTRYLFLFRVGEYCGVERGQSVVLNLLLEDKIPVCTLDECKNKDKTRQLYRTNQRYSQIELTRCQWFS